MKKIYMLAGTFLLFLMSLCFGNRSFATYITVDINGTAMYTSVQAAINAAPVGTAANPDTIFIKNGRYKEKISVPAAKPYIVMIGESVANVILTYDDGASTVVLGQPLGTQNSASFSISANNFTAMNITIANSFGDGSQAVAVLVNSDQVAFRNCRFLGNQDTLYIKGSGTPKHYFSNCYIDGNVDFIFGSSVAVFDTCVIYGKIKPSISSTYMVAPNTTTGQAYGMVFRGCKLAGNTPASYYYLGRPWQSNPKAVFIRSIVYGNMIIPAGWSSNSAGSATLNDSYFAEFESTNGSGTLVDTMLRVAQSDQLTPTQAAAFTLSNIFGSWNPCALFNCISFTPNIAMTNMRAIKGTTYDTIKWNIAWPIAGVQYQLYRSSDSINYTPLAAQIITSPNDTTWNFQFIDTVPAQGNIYWYYVKATKTGYATHNGDTVKISSAPTIYFVGSSGNPFTQYLGAPSAPQTYTLSASNLTANLAITAPSNYEISTNGGSTYAASASLTPTSGNVASTTIYVRLNASALGNYSGNVVHTSTGAQTFNLAVSGSTIPAPVVVTDTLILWPLNVSNVDSAAVRSAGVAATTPTMSRLYNSTAVSVTTIPAYSPTYGNAFGASSTLDGAWGTANGGPGGNLNRTYYMQYTVKAATGDSIRIDSLILASAFYATSSSTKIAVVWSRTGFVSDSTDVSGGSGPGGALPGSANGGFLTPIALAQQNAGPTNVYRLALNGPLGVKTDTGGTITIRIYYSCSSSSAGRYGMLKGVLVLGDYMAFQTPCPPPALLALGDTTFCAGDSVVLKSGSIANGNTYVWKNNGVVIAGAADSMFSALTTGNYTVTVTQGSCTNTSPSIHVTANPLPDAAVTASGPLTFCQGDSVRFTVLNYSGYTYAWKNGTTTIAGATDTAYTVYTSGSYAAFVTSAAGCENSSAAQVVQATPLPTPVIGYNGGVLSVSTYNSYQWYLNGNIIAGATNANYTPTTDGNYTVKVDSASCFNTSAAYNVSGLGVDVIMLNGSVVGIYPNPARDIVFIHANGTVNVMIKDVSGRIVKNAADAKQVNVSSLSDGIYIISLTDEHGTLLGHQRLVKNK